MNGNMTGGVRRNTTGDPGTWGTDPGRDASAPDPEMEGNQTATSTALRPAPSATRLITRNAVPDGFLDGRTPILVVMGVCGCGKTTLNENLSSLLGWDSAEADDFHPQANIDKMSRGIPLTDDDRWGWLESIGSWIDDHIRRGEPGTITCSALKRVYRDRLRRPGVVFVHLAGDYDAVLRRMRSRSGHFMKVSMLDSQFAILESPQDDEAHLTLDVASSATPAEEAAAVAAALGLAVSEKRMRSAIAQD
ncbi:gluconokinase [uncultured Bifidobacterium sp.]|uniref:gluconokinase n=1 Tax=uncultured Bifidobacterium sp. TaxID=165187 RepID=UPI0028DCFD6F|nr:gluconokinase [uncultured Bifidobacterium sp.]